MKNYVSKGFWTRKGKPTQMTVLAYLYILKNLPKGKTIADVNNTLIKRAQRFVGIPASKDSTLILRWGINPGCALSKTSSERYIAMSKGLDMAKMMIATGLELSTVSP